MPIKQQPNFLAYLVHEYSERAFHIAARAYHTVRGYGNYDPEIWNGA